MRVYVHIYEELFSKTLSPNLALPLQHRLLDWRLTRFGKELFIFYRNDYSIIVMISPFKHTTVESTFNQRCPDLAD